jgi:aspartate/methionine/tyrosine aminotransferase
MTTARHQPTSHHGVETTSQVGSNLRPSTRSRIPPFYVMEVMRAAEARERAGQPVLHMEVGQPSTPAPVGARQAVRDHLDTHTLGYTGAAGLPQLRERIALWYRERYDVVVDPARVVVTTGASGSCLLAFLALYEHGDRVGVIEPGYPCYRNDLRALGIEVVQIPVGHEHRFRPTPELLDTAGQLDGLVLASPSNPTGTVLSDHELAALITWCSNNGVRLVVDEIYHGIVHTEHPTTALGLSDDVVVFNSFSKYFSMTGWRLGWVVAPEPVAAAIERLAQNLTIAPPTVSQIAALAAFDCTDELEANVERYRANRDIMIGGLRSIGLDSIAPADGAFYVWADVSELVSVLGTDSQELCRRWLDELGVAVTPGVDFDQFKGDRFVRFSYAGSAEDIAAAMAILGRWMAEARATAVTDAEIPEHEHPDRGPDIGGTA